MLDTYLSSVNQPWPPRCGPGLGPGRFPTPPALAEDPVHSALNSHRPPLPGQSLVWVETPAKMALPSFKRL